MREYSLTKSDIQYLSGEEDNLRSENILSKMHKTFPTKPDHIRFPIMFNEPFYLVRDPNQGD